MLSTFTAEFEMPIWRVLPFTDQPLLAVELRDSGLLEAKFAVTELNSGNIILAPSPGPEKWWIGLQAAGHGQLYLQQFHQQPQVGISGLSALSLSKGMEVWQKKDVALREVRQQYLLTQPASVPDSDFILLDPVSGNKIAGDESRTIVEEGRKTEPEFPISYSPDNLHYTTLEQFLQLKLHVKVQGPLEYLETAKHIIFSYHLQEENSLVNYLVIFANSGHLRFRKRLNTALTGFATDTFFYFAEKVICVQDKTKLLIIDLHD